jgi:transposase InsO family protein
LLNGSLVGYALDNRMTQNLVMQTRCATKRPGKWLIHHPDRGSQYCASAYRKLLRQFEHAIIDELQGELLGPYPNVKLLEFIEELARASQSLRNP